MSKDKLIEEIVENEPLWTPHREAYWRKELAKQTDKVRRQFIKMDRAAEKVHEAFLEDAKKTYQAARKAQVPDTWVQQEFAEMLANFMRQKANAFQEDVIDEWNRWISCV